MLSWAELNRRAGGGRLAHPKRKPQAKANNLRCERKRWAGLRDRTKKRARRHNRTVAAQYAAAKAGVQG